MNVISNTYNVHVTFSQPESHFPEKHHAPRQLTPTGTGSESQPQFNRQLLQQGGLPQQVDTSCYQHNETYCLATFQLHYTFCIKLAWKESRSKVKLEIINNTVMITKLLPCISKVFDEFKSYFFLSNGFHSSNINISNINIRIIKQFQEIKSVSIQFFNNLP